MTDSKAEMAEVEVQVTDTAAEKQEEAEVFDRERAMETIRKQREENKLLKREAAELARYRQAEEERKKAEMTETERLKAELEQLQSEAKRAQIRARQMELASKYELPVAIAERLKGESLEEMEADAQAMKELLPKKKEAPHTGATNPGDKAGEPSEFESDHRKWKAANGKFVNPFAGGGVVFPPGS